MDAPVRDDSTRPRSCWKPAVVSVLLGALAGLAVVAIFWVTDPLFPYRGEMSQWYVVRGRVEGPPDVRLRGLTILATKDHRSVGRADVDADGSFRIRVRGEGPVDLQVADLSEPEPGTVRTGLHRVGSLEGTIRGIRPMQDGVGIRLVTPRTASIRVRVRGPTGEPLPGARVSLRSMADLVELKADAGGEVLVPDLPVRRWTLTAESDRGVESALVYARQDVVPDGQDIEMRIPRGVRVSVRLPGRVPADVEVSVPHPIEPSSYVGPWRPEADGSMTFFVGPDVESLYVAATDSVEQFAQGAVAVSEGAVLTLTPVRDP